LQRARYFRFRQILFDALPLQTPRARLAARRFPLLEANASLVWAANKANGSREGCSLFRLVLVASLAGKFVVLGLLLFELVRELRGGVDVGPAVASRTARPITCDAAREVSGILPPAPPNQK
jgi:hypothetical protein